MSDTPWYRDGLRFACTRCGNCCVGEGYVWVDDAEIAALAAETGLDEATFRQRHTREVPERGVTLTEKADGACVFWHPQAGCLAYEARPRQCRTWPFWGKVVRDEASWAAAGAGCPGIDQGPLHPADAITAIADDDGLAPEWT